MSMKKAIQAATSTAINSIGDLADSFTYQQRTIGVYNTTSGATSDTFTNVTVKGVLQPSTERNRASTDETVVEEKVLLLAKQDIAFAPKLQDRLNDGTNDFEVVGVRTDTADALASIGLRRI